jgi:hypothetical protein
MLTVHNDLPVSFDIVIFEFEFTSLDTVQFVCIYLRLIILICDVLRNGTGGGFLRVLRFPLPILTPPTVPLSLIILSQTLYSVITVSVVR